MNFQENISGAILSFSYLSFSGTWDMSWLTSASYIVAHTVQLMQLPIVYLQQRIFKDLGWKCVTNFYYTCCSGVFNVVTLASLSDFIHGDEGLVGEYLNLFYHPLSQNSFPTLAGYRNLNFQSCRSFIHLHQEAKDHNISTLKYTVYSKEKGMIFHISSF